MTTEASWIDVLSEAELEAAGKRVVRAGGRQILLVRTARGIVACPNRCPHEGYPLSEGDLCADGTLRCNWHNWTFDLDSGETLVGADRLQRIPVKVEGGRVLLAPERPATGDVRRRVLAAIPEALGDTDLPRLLRETARLTVAGGDPLDVVRAAVLWLSPRLRYGTTHAFAGAPDWLLLADGAEREDERLAAYGEVLGHIADDGRRDREYPYATEPRAWEAEGLLAAIEAADEAVAIAFVRGALAAGNGFADLVPVLARAALAHYGDFGHSLIYVVKSAELAERLGESVDEALLCALVRSLCFATREDLLPEFRAYRPALERFGVAAPNAAARPVRPLRDVSIAEALAAVVDRSYEVAPETLYRLLVDAAAATLLHVDERTFVTTSGSIAKNAGWLDHTHALTFAEAGERVARETPALWPAVLLQIACFIGRTHASVDFSQDMSRFLTEPPEATFAALRASLADHGRERFILSVHLIKTLFAAERLVRNGHGDAATIAAALKRFFSAPVKGRHVIRTARQMLAVAEDG